MLPCIDTVYSEKEYILNIECFSLLQMNPKMTITKAMQKKRKKKAMQNLTSIHINQVERKFWLSANWCIILQWLKEYIYIYLVKIKDKSVCTVS